MATIEEQLQAMYARRPTPRALRVAKLRVKQVQKVNLGPPPRPPVYVSAERMEMINRAHKAAMTLIHGRGRSLGGPSCEADGMLLLSYVVWPTDEITTALEAAAA